MVLGAGPADVETVIVAGDVVKRDRQLVGAHVKRAHHLMHQTQDRLRSKDTPSTTDTATLTTQRLASA
jgi:5-methylthioadenosine/S-adenosylhomocysteine deaminase